MKKYNHISKNWDNHDETDKDAELFNKLSKAQIPCIIDNKGVYVEEKDEEAANNEIAKTE
jgi:hypothetical protein